MSETSEDFRSLNNDVYQQPSVQSTPLDLNLNDSIFEQRQQDNASVIDISDDQPRTVATMNDDIDDATAFVSTNGRPHGHGLFITFPQVGNLTLNDAKELFVRIDMLIKQQNKKLLGDVQGGCCVENHHNTKGIHFHIVINYKGQERFYLTAKLSELITRSFKQGNYQVLKNYPAACKYIRKDGNFWFNYDNDQEVQNRVQHRKLDTAMTIKELKEGNYLALEDGRIQPQHILPTIRGIQALKNLNQPTWDLSEKQVWFIYGTTRTGKSTYARSVIGRGSYYIKAANTKWFEGYEGQDTIIIEDLPKYTDFMMYHLKMWLDTVHQRVEVKGYSVWLNARNIVITSNHCLWDCLAKLENDGHTTMNNDDYNAVKARIHHIWKATSPNFDYTRVLETFQYVEEK